MDVLTRRWRVIGLVLVSALVGTLAGVLAGARHYEAIATLQVPVASASGASVGYDDLNYTDRLVNTYKQIGESNTLREQVQRALPAARDAEVAVEPKANTEFVELRAEASDPRLAARVANSWAQALVREVRTRAARRQADVRRQVTQQLDQIAAELPTLRSRLASADDAEERARLEETIRVRESQYQAVAEQAAAIQVAGTARVSLSLAFPATTPSGRSLASLAPTAALGLLLGLIAGAGLALLLERRSPSVESLEDIERAAGATVLGTIPALTEAHRGALNGDGRRAPVVFNSGSLGQEAFGRLRAQLLSGARSLPCTVLVTSPADGDGKSLVAANLAAALARARRKVVLVDGDLRNPSLHKAFHVENDRGLSDALESEPIDLERLQAHLRSTEVLDLDLLTAGAPSYDATELVASDRMRDLVEALEELYDFIVVDSPALSVAADATAVAPLAHVVVLVVGRTPVSDRTLHGARRQLGNLGIAELGIVVNRWRDRGPAERVEA